MALQRDSWGRVTLAIALCLAGGAFPAACGSDNPAPLTGGGGDVGKDGSTRDTGVATDGSITTDAPTTLPDGGPLPDVALLPDGAVADTSLPDAPDKDGSDDEGVDGGGKITFDGGTAHVRLLHAAPDGAPIDMCIRPSGATAFGAPVLGGGPGLAFANAADAGSLIDGYYDIAIVGAPASDCSVFTAKVLNVPLVDTMTIAYIETIFPPSTQGFDAIAIAQSGTPSAGKANVRFNVTQGAAVDLYGIQGAATRWFNNVNVGRSTDFFGVTAGTYSLRVTPANDVQQLTQQDNVSLASTDVIDVFLYLSFPTNAGATNLMRCPVTNGAAVCVTN